MILTLSSICTELRDTLCWRVLHDRSYLCRSKRESETPLLSMGAGRLPYQVLTNGRHSCTRVAGLGLLHPDWSQFAETAFGSMVYFPFAHSQQDSTPAGPVAGYDTTPVTRAGQPEKLSLWERLTTVRINPSNNKCTTLPILKLNNPYSINFHLYVYLCSTCRCRISLTRLLQILARFLGRLVSSSHLPRKIGLSLITMQPLMVRLLTINSRGREKRPEPHSKTDR